MIEAVFCISLYPLPLLPGARDSALSPKTSKNRKQTSLIHYKECHWKFSYTMLWTGSRSNQFVIQQIPGAPSLGIKQPENGADLTDCQE
jgi:hypothetical protein